MAQNDEQQQSAISRAAAKLKENEAASVENSKNAEDEYFDEKTKLELLQKVNLLISLQIDDTEFCLVNDDNYARTKKMQPIIVSHIGGTYLHLQQRKWDLTMEAGLSQVMIEDHVCDSSQLQTRPYLMRTGHVKRPSIARSKSAFKLDAISDDT